MTRTARLGAALLAALLAVAALTLAPSEAATLTVRLTNNGPDPDVLTLKAGDRVVFRNDDGVPHQVTSQGGWQFDSGPIPPGRTSDPTPALTAPGTYRYSDVRGIVLLPRTFDGRLVVPAPKPSPSASPRPSASSRPTPSRSASPAPVATPSASPTVLPSATPSASPAPSATPPPSPSASPEPSAVPSASPSLLPPTYGDPQALVQSSPHRYGLPALVALVLALGVLSLLGRYLLALPEGRPAERPRW